MAIKTNYKKIHTHSGEKVQNNGFPYQWGGRIRGISCVPLLCIV